MIIVSSEHISVCEDCRFSIKWLLGEHVVFIFRAVAQKGGGKLHWNVCNWLPVDTASYTSRLVSSSELCENVKRYIVSYLLLFPCWLFLFDMFVQSSLHGTFIRRRGMCSNFWDVFVTSCFVCCYLSVNLLRHPECVDYVRINLNEY